MRLFFRMWTVRFKGIVWDREVCMHKIFIACPFIKFIEGSTFINNDFRKFTENLYNLCSEYAPEVFLALKREEYGAKPLPYYSCSMDLDEVKSSDIIVAIPDDSMGVAVELGWMSAMGKTVILVLNRNQKYTPLVADIHKITPGKVIYYEGEEMSSLPDIREALEYYQKLEDEDGKQKDGYKGIISSNKSIL